jgi:hypothetical protein
MCSRRQSTVSQEVSRVAAARVVPTRPKDYPTKNPKLSKTGRSRREGRPRSISSMG